MPRVVTAQISGRVVPAARRASAQGVEPRIRAEVEQHIVDRVIAEEIQDLVAVGGEYARRQTDLTIRERPNRPAFRNREFVLQRRRRAGLGRGLRRGSDWRGKGERRRNSSGQGAEPQSVASRDVFHSWFSSSGSGEIAAGYPRCARQQTRTRNRCAVAARYRPQLAGRHDPDQLHPSCLLSMRIWSRAKTRAADIADSEGVRADAPWKGFRMLTFSIENY